jgi:hypothetical protein
VGAEGRAGQDGGCDEDWRFRGITGEEGDAEEEGAGEEKSGGEKVGFR